MKTAKARRALSPVVASIILIAVTVAVSIAVAAWMGALSFSFMGTEQFRITEVVWTPNTGFSLTVNNTGTKDSAVDHLEINYGQIDNVYPATPTLLKAGTALTLTVTYVYVNGNAYDISAVSTDGSKFTGHFVGGQNYVD